MVDSVAPLQSGQLGTGTFTIGATGSQIDCSALLNNGKIVMSKDQSDPTKKLDGQQRGGTTTYTYEFQGNVDVDISLATGLFATSQDAKGTEVPFEYVPSTAEVTSATGMLILDPLDFGADEMGADLTSDFTWALVGDPVYTYGP